MATDKALLKELFEIAETDYILAKSILETEKIKIDFETINKYSGSRNSYIKEFLILAVNYVDEESLNQKILLKLSKDSVQTRRNTSMHLLLKYKINTLDISDILYFLEHTYQKEIYELILDYGDNFIVTKDNFKTLISLYDSANREARNYLHKILLRTDKELLDFDYMHKGRNVFGKQSRLIFEPLLAMHFPLKLTTTELVEICKLSARVENDLYCNLIKERISSGEIPRSFWEKMLDKLRKDNCFYIAEEFIRLYPLTELQEAEKNLFLSKL